MASILTVDFPVLRLDGGGVHLVFMSAVQMCLPDPTWMVGERWKGLEIVRGMGLCMEIKLWWNGERAEEGLVEGFGRWISDAEMWTQLQFETSLQVKGDAIIDLTRSLQTPAATELRIPGILQTASLMAIILDFRFCGEHASPGLKEFEVLADMAIRNLWEYRIAQLAPLVGKMGCLERVSAGAEYVGVVSDAIVRVAGRAMDGGLKEKLEGVEVGQRVWRVLVDGVKGKKSRGSALKSMVKGEKREEEDDELLLGGESEKELLLGETETEDRFFTSEDEGSLLNWDDEDGESLFDWDDYQEEDPFFFEGFEEQVEIDYHVDEKSDLLFTDDYEPAEVSAGESDMICI